MIWKRDEWTFKSKLKKQNVSTDYRSFKPFSMSENFHSFPPSVPFIFAGLRLYKKDYNDFHSDRF